jgi:hypothetical protein
LMRRARLSIHGLNRWLLNCLEMSRKRGFEKDKKARCDDISIGRILSCVSKY